MRVDEVWDGVYLEFGEGIAPGGGFQGGGSHTTSAFVWL